jgi:hypothetical protein
MNALKSQEKPLLIFKKILFFSFSSKVKTSHVTPKMKLPFIPFFGSQYILTVNNEKNIDFLSDYSMILLQRKTRKSQGAPIYFAMK